VAYQREDIEQVRAATNLVELVSEVTKVRRSGRSVSAICPFHQEKTPSLSVDPGRGLYHCFGCGNSGDVFRFVQETQGLGFSDAVELLARRAGITLRIDPEAAKRQTRRAGLVDAVAKAVDFYHDRLRSAPDAGEARSYLRGRNYDGDVVDRYQIGYSPDAWDGLVSHLKAAKVSESDMVGAGLVSKSRQGRLVDRFRGRVMFPIYDLRGDPVGFGARLLAGEGPKYLNSPETALYQKSRLLYGLNWSKSEIVRSGYSVVVEGYTDVIAMDMAGLPVAVATCGTALGEDHLDLLRRFSERVVLAFDADVAGAGASLRGFERSVPGDLDLRVAELPTNLDPADLVLSGEIDALRKAVEESQPLLQFRIEQELAGFDLTETEARIRGVRAAAKLVGRHPDRLVRSEYAVQLSRRTGVDLDDITAIVEQAARAEATPPDSTARPSMERLSGQQKAEREWLRLMLDNHPGVASADIDVTVITSPLNVAAYAMLEPVVVGLEVGAAPDLGSLLGEDDSEPAVLLRELAMDQRPMAEPEDLVRKLQVGALERRIENLQAQLRRVDPEHDKEEHAALFSELIALERERRDLGDLD
jgi:DNA primase